MKTITFEEYLQEAHAQDYRWTDDWMVDDFYENYLSNLDNETLQDYFEIYIHWDYADNEIKNKYLMFINSLTN